MLRLQGLSASKVAMMASVNRSTLACVVSGNRGVSIPIAHRIAAAVDCRPETLFPSLRALKESAA